jgi:hypothetical protein
MFMEIYSTRNYPLFLIDLRRLPILVFLCPLFCFDKEVYFIGYIMVSYIILAQLNYKFATSIKLEDSRLIIQYKHFFINRVKSLSLKHMVIDMVDYKDIVMRGAGSDRPPNYLMTILIDGDRKFRVDTRVGFTKEDFLELMRAVGRAPIKD